MSSNSLIGLVVFVLSLVVLDIFCADLTNLKQSNLPVPSDNTQQKSTTPWPSLKDRWTVKPRPQNDLRRPPKGTAPKWVQQNNIWIRNEQAVAEEQNNQNTHRNVPNYGPSTPKTTTTTTEKNTYSSNNRQPPYQNVPNNPTQKNTQNENVWGHNNAQNQPTNLDKNFPDLTIQKNPTTTPRNMHPTPMRQNSWAEIVSNGASGTPKSVVATTKGYTKDSDNQNPFGNQDIENLQVSDSPVTDEELREFSETLLKRDVNNAAKYVTVNLQSMTTSRSDEDKAPQPLLQIDSEAYKIPSIEKIILLYNNYFLDSSQNEVHTGAERIEENDLLDAVINTPVMQYARTFLMQKGKIGKDPKEFREVLKLIWFNMYSRGQGRIGSSGFEHVFVAELKNNQVSGLHSWLYFNEEEKNNRANYLGYMKKLDLGNKGAILKYHFTFHDVDKPVGSMFIGTSPELEMALYSTCFLLRADRICPLKMNDNRFIIRTYTFKYRGKHMIGSAFPEI